MFTMSTPPVKMGEQQSSPPPSPLNKTEGEKIELLIAFGTTTGTAREVGERIAREAYSFTSMTRAVRVFNPRLISMQHITVKYLAKHWIGENKRVIFVISTTGQGKFPDDSIGFWRQLRDKRTLSLPITFGMIGLGDSSYQMFNYPGKKLYSRLGQLNGISPFEICLCDDQHDLGYIGALNPFLEECWRTWIPESCNSNQNSRPLARYTLLTSTEEDKGQSQSSETCESLELRKMICNDRITSADHFQDTRLIAFDTQRSNLFFEAGDVVQVFQENFPDNVKKFFELFPHLKEQSPFYLVSDPDISWVAIPPEFYKLCGPQPWTWEIVAEKMINLHSIPGVYAFEILKFFATDPLVKEKFEEYCGPEGLEELYNYNSRPRRTILEVLLDFPSTAVLVPPNYLFELIPFMRPRAFSIASPPRENHHIEILVAVVEYQTNLKTKRKGTCSYWLAHHCNVGQEVGLRIEKGSLRPPPRDAHVLMIGPGTGVAPFRSMIKEHLQEWDKHLFFGCRNKDKDFYFGNEFTELVQQKKMSFYPAFSRDDPSRREGKYVQDLIVKQDELFRRMLLSDMCIYVYVCGRAGKMPKDVRDALKDVFLKVDIPDPEGFVQFMVTNGYYQSETY